MRDNPNNNMETFYEENAQFCSTQTSTPVNSMKRPLTLDLNAKPPQKRQRFNQSITAPTVLSSPDVNMLKITSPEIEKFILSNSTLQTPTPSLSVYPPTKVTTEQEDYAKGFEEALTNLRNSENTNNVLTNSSILHHSMNGGGIVYTNLDDSFPIAIKDEPQTVPNSPPVSPIDLENQEQMKLERKRQRNRVAASKCRKRKLERISKLEEKVNHLKKENADLGNVVLCLKEHVSKLKQQVMEHVGAGCAITLNRLI